MDNSNNNNIRKLPQDIVAEQAVLGSILVSPHPRESLEVAAGKLTTEDFLRDAHKYIFDAMMLLNEQRREIDTLTLTDQLGDKLNLVGGEVYFGDLINSTPTSSNLEYYADIVRKKSMQRRLIESMTDLISQSYDNDVDVEAEIADIKLKLDALEDNRANIDFKSIKNAVKEATDQYFDRGKAGGNPVTGIATGFHEFDKVTTGFHENQLIILAARPGVGKTAFVLNMAINAANNLSLEAGNEKAKPVVVFNMEMNANQLVDRMLATQAMVPLHDIQTGANQNLKDSQDLSNYERVMVGGDKLNKLNFWIDDTPGININEIRAKLRRLVRDEKQDLGLVIIDYLQLIESNNRESRQQAVSEISRSLKKMSMEMNVPIVALSQLSRGVESRINKKPMLSDLRESGAIEQDADIVAFLYRDDYYDNDSENFTDDPREESDISNVELIIEKNRQGERKTINLMFNKPYQKFSNQSMIDPSEMIKQPANNSEPNVANSIDDFLNGLEEN